MENDASKGKKLISGVGIYAIGTFGTKILSFLIVPLYTYYLATSEMGVYDILISTVQLLAPIMTMQISDAAYRWIIRDDVKDKERYIRATLQVLLINCSITVAIILVINQIHSIPYCTYFCIILVLNRSFQTIQKILRGIKKQWLFAVSGIIYTSVYLSLNVLQLCVLHQGVESLFQSMIAANFVAICMIFILEPRFRMNYFRKPERAVIFEMYRYSIPLVPNYLNWWIINSSDRYIILWAMGSSANGILAVAHKFPSILQAVLGLFTRSWQDQSVADSEKNDGKYYSRVFRIYYLFGMSAMFPLIPATKLVIHFIMSSAYKSACDYVAFYYLGGLFQSFATFYGVGYLRSKQTGKAFTTSVYGAIVNAFINIAFVKLIGLQSAAVSTFFGFLVMWILRERQNRDELKITIKWKEFISLTVIAVAVAVASILLNLAGNAVLFLAGAVAFVVINYKSAAPLIEKLKKRKKKKKSST